MNDKDYFGMSNGEVVVSEAGMYLFAFTSFKDNEISAELTDWVCREVLPALRKNGFYMLDGSKSIKIINTVRQGVAQGLYKSKPDTTL